MLMPLGFLLQSAVLLAATMANERDYFNMKVCAICRVLPCTHEPIILLFIKVANPGKVANPQCITDKQTFNLEGHTNLLSLR